MGVPDYSMGRFSMSSLVSIDCKDGTLRRYETAGGGGLWRLTHKAVPKDGPNALTRMLIEGFRVDPPSDFAIDELPPEPPQLPPAVALPVPVEAPCDVQSPA